MVETKSVKVDNWGVFFLQKLQNFFNKTDYCDLTLQFMDNSQLKVHRLVLSACTDYFNVLEQQTDCTDDILNMPYDLQADVVVPIVNFMYTGTLEFEVNMYGRLLKTAKDMNMTVLLKLLEAHKRTVDVTPIRAPPVLLNKGAAGGAQYQRGASAVAYGRGGAAGQQQQQNQRYNNSPAARRNNATSPSTGSAVPAAAKPRTADPTTRIGVRAVAVAHGGQQQASGGVRKAHVPETVRVVAKATAASSRAAPTRGPSRFDGEQANTTDQFESSFDNITYESRPLITARQIIKEESGDDGDATSRSFEQLRRGYTGVKRPATTMTTSIGADSPPEKKPNIEDVKEYIEAHRMRKKIVEEFNEDEDEDDEEQQQQQQQTSTSKANTSGASDDNVDHQKIISEVLKKYPHLVKSNKNIKLKITQKGQQQTITAPLRKTATPPSSAVAGKSPSNTTVAAKLPTTTASAVAKPPAAVVKASPEVAGKLVVAVPTAAPKKIDSKTMHALIAKGAENTTGPWLCLKCGVSGRPISIPSYKGFRRHLINVHKQKIDPKLCEHCGWRSTHKSELHHHMFVVHNITPPADLRFPKCGDCVFIAVDSRDLRAHQLEAHSSTTIKYPSSALPTASSSSAQQQQHCIYCNKTFADETRLFEHIKTVHKERACEDGLMEEDDDQLDGERGGDDDDDDDLEDDDEEYVPSRPVAAVPEKRKINVLSSITLPSKGGYVLDGTKVAKVPTSLAAAATSGKPSSADRAEVTVSRLSGTLDPVTGTFAADEEENSHAAAQQHADEEMMEDDGNKSNNATPAVATAAAVSAAAVAQMSQDEADNHAYLEFVMAEVHGEKKQSDIETPTSSAAIAAGGADDTHFVTEEGATMQLTDEQKKELIDQLHDQSGVVMVLKDDSASAAVGEAAAATTSTAAASNAANQMLDDLTESMDWELEVPPKTTVEGDANKAKACAVAQLSEKAKELIGDWSADETDESMVDESGKTVEEEDQDEEESATKADATNVNEHKPSAEGVGSADDASTATAASAIVKRAYGGRGSRDSNKEIDVAGSSSTTAATSETKELDEDEATTSTTKTAAAATTTVEHEEAEEEVDNHASSAEINEPKRDAETMKKDSNIEIKSLINDWGEEDDEE